MRILVADGSALLRSQLIEMLCELEGVEVVGQARDASDALSAVGALAPDVTLLDLQMFGGGDALAQLKRGGRAPVVIVMSSRVCAPYRRSCLAAGADYFFDKACEIEELKRVIRELLPPSAATDA